MRVLRLFLWTPWACTRWISDNKSVWHHELIVFNRVFYLRADRLGKLLYRILGDRDIALKICL